MKIKLGDKVVETDESKDGVPVIKAWTEEIKYPDGRQDVIVHVPCLKIQSKTNE